MDKRKLLLLGNVLTPQRVRMMEIIASGVPGVTALARAINRTHTGTTRHLDRLRAAGVVEQDYREDGRRGPIRVNEEGLRELVNATSEWVDTLGAS